ncbi:mannitol dehydrogenase family protein [Salipiger sp. IMCC34102]|uniref:mannitol dehydrogenase family protein n=1 Tax=Salipiger sp. IMCC34102 TaxID=2510647 RepID=UPI00101D8D1C|nr:mannitol dehydrogenase family protein [Salipiger sp. IMCC34102]RYH03498.1 mannitol dehydrogenase family protein [Salipiger sp. IMCC34102]
MTDRLTRTTPKPKAGIVHLGPGAFFRAFNAVYTDEAMAKAGGDWGILAVSLRSPDARDQLAPQDGAYTAVTLGPEGREAQVVGSITGCLVAPEDPGAVLEAMADPAIRIVSLTITEKGYCHNPATGKLMRDHPDIVHDLEHPEAPRSAPGFLTAALARRRAAGHPPFTVLSCDNLPSNGALAKQVVLDFARARDEDLAEWIANEVRFPATMVDRITPATTEADIAALEKAAGYSDPAMVAAEPFRQWVIEDSFAQGRPAWDEVGVQMVADVEAHELMKLRCLNGTHSTLAYLGYLAGYETIAETVADPDFAALCRKMWDEEIIPTLPRPEGEDLARYTAALLERYRNPGIRHRTWQIAMDGSQKLPQRMLGTVADCLDRGTVPEGLCLAVAGWIRYVSGTDEAGTPIDVRDPMADRLRVAATSADPVDAVLALDAVFPVKLARDARFRDAVASAHDRLMRDGAARTVQAYVR